MTNDIQIRKVSNGYIVTISNSIRKTGFHVYKNTEEFEMLEDIGRELLDYKVRVERR
jgi:hypothetical protein